MRRQGRGSRGLPFQLKLSDFRMRARAIALCDGPQNRPPVARRLDLLMGDVGLPWPVGLGQQRAQRVTRTRSLTARPHTQVQPVDGDERAVLASHGDPRVIMVTSANDEEGKTTCALNLALVLAGSGRTRVLLVEANTQTPALTSLLGFTTPACLTDQLTQHRTDPARPWRVAPISSHDLDVLAVQPRNEPHLPLRGPSLLAAITGLRRVYDYVVIDTSSILAGLDVPLVQDAADGIVLVARTRHTRARTLNAAMDQIGSDRLLGVALLDP